MAPKPLHNLESYLKEPVAKLVEAPEVKLTEEAKERHRIFSLLLMAITAHYWNGLKNGRSYSYPLNPSKDLHDKGLFLEDDYHGHNISCVAVDLNGRVIDFEFNHNELFNSSAEHAEARLVRRVFSLAQINDAEATGTIWEFAEIKEADAALPKNYATILSGVSIYTTLESCSQCSGIMALGQVKEIIYLQQDPGMYFIGNILRRLTVGTGLQAPLPISGSDIDFPFFSLLNKEYDDFRTAQDQKKGEPFRRNGQEPLWSNSITSYLCTRSAYLLFVDALQKFETLVLKYPDYRPENKSLVKSAIQTLSNQQALDSARSFFEYATRSRRGTPHRV